MIFLMRAVCSLPWINSDWNVSRLLQHFPSSDRFVIHLIFQVAEETLQPLVTGKPKHMLPWHLILISPEFIDPLEAHNIPARLPAFTLIGSSLKQAVNPDQEFEMTPEITEQARVGDTSCSESLHQAHLKSWFIGPDSTQSSSEANFREIEGKMHSPPDLSLPGTSLPSNCQSDIVGACRSLSVRRIWSSYMKIEWNFTEDHTIDLMPRITCSAFQLVIMSYVQKENRPIKWLKTCVTTSRAGQTAAQWEGAKLSIPGRRRGWHHLDIFLAPDTALLKFPWQLYQSLATEVFLKAAAMAARPWTIWI